MTPHAHYSWIDRHPVKSGCLLLAVLAAGGLGLMIADAAGVLEAWLRFAGQLLVGWMIHGRGLVEGIPPQHSPSWPAARFSSCGAAGDSAGG